MFTGIVEDIGHLTRVSQRGAVRVFTIKSALDLSDTQLGDSIAVNGVCLTVTRLDAGANGSTVDFDVGPESQQVTALGKLKSGSRVHLERALRLQDRLGGHLMQGHVDGVGILKARTQVGDTLKLTIALDDALLKYCIHKGSIALNGVSLTLNVVHDDSAEVWLIPHTLEQTNLGALRIGDPIHIETDVIGKYVERLLKFAPSAVTSSGITHDFLRQHGF